MKVFIGFIFTEGPIEDLRRRGFVFETDESNSSAGFKSYQMILHDSVKIEIREVLDEDLYLKFHNLEHFEPLIVDSEQSTRFSQTQENGVEEFVEVLTSASVLPKEIHDYLRIRKPFFLWALHLKCKNFAIFQGQAKPKQLCDYQGKRAALIHLGPQCFDFLISE